MAVPRKKKSHARKGTRRAHHSITGASASICPKCLSPKLHHHACGECGYYKGREAIKVSSSAV
jgi:large subunit ribosomal protein L32